VLDLEHRRKPRFACNHLEIGATDARATLLSMRTILLALITFLSVLLGGCGQEHQPANYQGKAAAAPWDSPERGGAQAAWEQAIHDRTANQNDYARMR
jgi:hypothetical protein